jgi:hypothetical protein
MAKDMEAVINTAIDNAVDEGMLSDVDATEDTVVDTSTDDAIETKTAETEAETTSEADVTPEAKQTEEAVDELLEELKASGFKPRNEKDNKIPYTNVQKITANREKRAVEAVAKALGADPTTVAFDKLETAIAEKIGSYASLEAEAENFHRAEEIMLNDADRYIRILATIEPQKYGKFLKVLGEGAAEETADDDFNIELPEFDLTLGNGVKTYSPEGIQKAFASVFKQAVEVGRKQASETAEAALRPIKDREAQAEETRYIEQRHKDIMTWRGMDTHYDAWLNALKADTKQATVGGRLTKSRLKYKTPEQAYIDVVVPLLQDVEIEKEQKAREKLIEDSNRKATSTAVGASAIRKKRTGDSGDPIMDAIERSLAKAGL